MAGENYIANEQTSQEIKAIIGNSNDTGGSSTAGTMMAKSNAILIKSDALNTAINTRAASSTALSTSTWTSTRASYLDYLANGTYGLSALRTLLNTINSNTNGGGSTIKSIQRGIVENASGLSNSKKIVTVSISRVDPAKCIVSFDLGYFNPESKYSNYEAGLRTLSATTMTFQPNYLKMSEEITIYETGWTIIEFF